MEKTESIWYPVDPYCILGLFTLHIQSYEETVTVDNTAEGKNKS